MSSSEDFKQAIRAGNINEAFLVAMSNAPELSITTKIITADGHRANINQSEIDNYLHTHINLIEGKVENEIGEKLTGDRYGEIKQFHLQQVTEGHQTIQRNLISLQKMFQLMSSFHNQQTLSHDNWVEIAANVTREPLSGKSETNQLYGNKIPNALEAGIESNTETLVDTEENYQPQLSSSEEEDDSVVNDLLSLTDIDDDSDEPETSSTSSNQADWNEWIDHESDVKPEVFDRGMADLKSLNIRDTAKNWQNWEAENESISESIDDSVTKTQTPELQE